MPMCRTYAKAYRMLNLYAPAHKVGIFGLAYISLAGCAHVQTMYVQTYCLAHDQQLPAEPPRVKSDLTGDAAKDVGILAGSAIRLRAWGEGLDRVLEGCREPSR